MIEPHPAVGFVEVDELASRPARSCDVRDLVHSGGPLPGQLKQLLDWLERLPKRHVRLFDGNEFVEPPEAVAKGGFEAIRGYFIDLYAEGFQIDRHVKAVIVGKEGAGKTRWVFKSYSKRVVSFMKRHSIQ